MTTTFAPISAKNITDFGIPSDLCSVEITGSDNWRISEEQNDQIFPDTSEVFPSVSNASML